MSIKLQAFKDQAAKGLSLGFFFSGHAIHGQLDLMTLMGSQMAQVNWESDHVWMKDDKGRHDYDSLAQLSSAVLGEALPLRALIHWMQGRPDPTLPSEPGQDTDSFTQLGWTINTQELGAKKLVATRPGSGNQRGVYIKVYLDR